MKNENILKFLFKVIKIANRNTLITLIAILIIVKNMQFVKKL